MGVPRFALSLAGYFKKVVATDIDLNLYTSVVSCFENLSEDQKQNTQIDVNQLDVPSLKIKATHDNGIYQKPSTTKERKAKRRALPLAK